MRKIQLGLINIIFIIISLVDLSLAASARNRLHHRNEKRKNSLKYSTPLLKVGLWWTNKIPWWKTCNRCKKKIQKTSAVNCVFLKFQALGLKPPETKPWRVDPPQYMLDLYEETIRQDLNEGDILYHSSTVRSFYETGKHFSLNEILNCVWSILM